MLNVLTHIDFFNNLSLLSFEELAAKDCKEISSRLEFLENIFINHIENLKNLSVGNTTSTALLNSTDRVEFVLKAMINITTLKTLTEYLIHWISKLLLCQRSITSLVTYLKKNCTDFQYRSNVRDERYLFHIINQIYVQMYGLCQNIGVAIHDYCKLYNTIERNISVRKKYFKPPSVQDHELDGMK